MSSRIIDLKTAAIESRDDAQVRDVPLLWANLLKSLSATAAYRRQIGPTLNPDDVIDFVLKRRQFPRSIVHCLDGIEETVGRLQAPGGMLRSPRMILRAINHYQADAGSPSELHQLIDEFQMGLADLDEALRELWFAQATK